MKSRFMGAFASTAGVVVALVVAAVITERLSRR